MPAKWFICHQNNEEIKNNKILISQCLKKCPYGKRCATLPYLRSIAYDREWRGVSPSSYGNGPRYLMLKVLTDYVVNPYGRAFAALGVGVHGKLSIYRYTENVLSEQELNDEEMKGIADVLEEDEDVPGEYVLTDYKTWGSYKVRLGLGIYKEGETIVDEEGKPIRFKSGARKGQIKTRQVIKRDLNKADLKDVSFQLNRYRIFFEKAGFPISRIQVQAIVRDGGTQAAHMNGVPFNIYLIDIPILPDNMVFETYRKLSKEVNDAIATRSARVCNTHESWGGRRCQPMYCEVYSACQAMDRNNGVLPRSYKVT